jgi:dTDP-4-amino-4,6-dideoxygalactose transaminase
MVYLIFRRLAERTALIEHLKVLHILPVFHYLALHSSLYYVANHDGRALPWANHYTDCLLRLPLYYELHAALQRQVIDGVLGFYQSN